MRISDWSSDVCSSDLESFQFYNQNFDKHHVKIASISLRMGKFYKNLGKYEKAKSFFKDSYLIYEKNNGRDCIKTIRVLQAVGEVYLLEDDLETAEKLFQKSLYVYQQNKHSDTYLSLEIGRESCRERVCQYG